MNDVWTRLAGFLSCEPRAALVTLLEIKGSAPREAGARMIVTPDGSYTGTIGGGQLELQAIQLAKGLIGYGVDRLCLANFALGPDLGQCCGGRVDIAVELFDAADLPEVQSYAGLEASGGFSCIAEFDPVLSHAERYVLEDAPTLGAVNNRADIARHLYRETFSDPSHPLILFGAGHVGRAVVLALANLPFRVTWVDERPDAFPKATPRNVTAVNVGNPADVIRDAPEAAFVLVMTHDHGQDFEICRAALSRSDIGYVGLIGSATKRARFLKRLRDSGIGDAALESFHCPIGVSGIDGKSPAVIAASAAAELLITLEARPELRGCTSVDNPSIVPIGPRPKIGRKQNTDS